MSDLHVLDIKDVRPWHFVNKRVVGGTSLIVKRRKLHQPRLIDQAVAQMNELGIDHLAITGDLTNLALPSEFAAARKLIDELAGPQRASVIPGNHDYYTADAEREFRFENTFRDYLTSDLPAYQQPTGYPFCHVRDDVAIIGLNTGIATPPFFATGYVRERELRATAALLADPIVRRRFSVVMLHHPLQRYPHERLPHLRRLMNAAEVMRVLREGRVDLAIHGHNHRHSTVEIPHLVGDGVMRICEAGSTSTSAYSHEEKGGKFNVYDIEGGALRKIDTYLYQPTVNQFVHWREVAFS